MTTLKKEEILFNVGPRNDKQRQLITNTTSPVQKLSFDVLCIIFCIASEKDGMAPLSIGAVCKIWRSVVMVAPLAWINVHGRLGAKGMSLYGIRSGTALLNVTLPKSFQRDISPISHRVRQLTAFSLPLGQMNFPNLVHLQILVSQHTDLQYRNTWSSLTCANFSSLSHLEVRSQGCFKDHFPLFKPSTFPPLRSLHLYFDPAYPTWLVLLRWFAGSLTSLLIHCNPQYRRPQYLSNVPLHYQVQFPLLQSLELGMASTMPLELKTPSLKFYYDYATGRKGKDSLGHKDIGSVDILRVDMIPSLPNMNQLRILQLLIPFDSHPTLLHQLVKDVTSCPCLEVVEFHGPYESEGTLLEKGRTLEKWLKENMPLRNLRLLVISGEW